MEFAFEPSKKKANHETTKGRKTRNNLESIQSTYSHPSFVFSFFRVFVMEFAFEPIAFWSYVLLLPSVRNPG
jgi:hypothetical protein